jgi:hypothetical protein
MLRVLATSGMVLLAGCFDFSKLDHLPDSAISPDLAGPSLDLSGDVLVLESFDTLDPTRWQEDNDSAAFQTDPNVRVEGTGAVQIDVTQLDVEEGFLHWIGSALPTQAGSRHLRFYVRYDHDITSNVDVGGLLLDDASSGDVVTLSSTPSDPSNGATVVNNQYQGHYTPSDVVVRAGEWHCYELGVDLLDGGAMWASSLRIDDHLQENATFVSALTQQVDQLVVGFNLAQSSMVGATSAWVDAVELRADAATIGCPYPHD